MLSLDSYKFISAISKPLIITGFYLRSIKQKAYRDRLDERLGSYPSTFKTGGIVVHGASVGEIIALQPLIEKLITRYPTEPLTVTTFTPTGSQQVLDRFGSSVQHCYLPIDAIGPVEKFLAALEPQIVVIMETEIWPNLIDQCHKRNIKTLLINGRISTRSFPRYQKIIRLIRPTLMKIDCILAQSSDDRDRLVSLGADIKKISISGNIKYDLSPILNVDERVEVLKRGLSDRDIWVVGSSHEDEEALILESYQLLLEDFPKLLLIIAPRHPERVQPLEHKIAAMPLTFIKRSEASQPTENTRVWLIDTMGELLLFYQLAKICTIAGSFGKTGGHNPLEACLFAKPMVVGTNMTNFNDIAEQLLTAKGMIQLKENSAEALALSIKNLLLDSTAADTLGNNAEGVLRKNRGAMDKTLTALSSLLS